MNALAAARRAILRTALTIPVLRTFHSAWRALAGRSEVRKIVSNVGWLFADRALSLVSSFAVGILVVRYLGPEDYGVLSYARGFVALFVPLVGLGLQDIVVRELAKGDQSPAQVLGTAFALQLPAALVGFALAIGTGILSEGTGLTRLLIIMLATQLLFHPLDVLNYWFISQTESKYRVWAQNGALFGGAAMKVALVLGKLSVIGFAAATLAEVVFSYAALLGLARGRAPSVRSWRICARMAKRLVRDAWPLFLSGLAITVYMRVDTLMLGKMVGVKELGLYSAAVRLSELWYFVPVSIATSVFPAIVRASATLDQAVFDRRMQTFYDLMAVIGYGVALPVSILSPWLVPLLLGTEYAGAERVLSVHTWALVFVALGVARSRWLVAEDLVRYSMYATGVGVLVNLGLNLVLIPRYGAYGAAWATLASQAISSCLSSLLWQPLVRSFRQMGLSLLLPFRIGRAYAGLRTLLLPVGRYVQR